MRAKTPLLLALVVAGPARAQEAPSYVERALAGRNPPTSLSSELLDPTGRTRFHVTAQASFIEDGETFGDAGSSWAFEPFGAVRLAEGITVGGSLPFGVFSRPGTTEAVLGNLRLAGSAGASIPIDSADTSLEGLRLHLAGGLDLHFPTHSEPGEACNDQRSLCPGSALIAGLRAYDPVAFRPHTTAARVRAQVGINWRGLRLATEGAVIPGVQVSGPDEGTAFLEFAWAVRASAVIEQLVEPFAELLSSGTSLVPDQSALQRRHLALGVRLHFVELRPAVQVTIDLEQGAAFFGIDIATVLRPVLRSGASVPNLDEWRD